MKTKLLLAAALAAGVTMSDPDTVWLSADTRFAPDVTIGPNVRFGPGVSVGANGSANGSAQAGQPAQGTN